MLSLINGQSGGNGESNSGQSGYYDHDATAGNGIYRYVHCIKNRKILSYNSSNFTQLVSYLGAGISVYDPNNLAYTFSPGGGGAASIFADAIRNTPDASSSIPVDQAAEEFIDKFYRELRLQKWLDHHHQHRY